MQVAHREQRAGNIDRQIEGDTFVHILDVKVAAMLVGGGGGNGDACRSRADNTDHRDHGDGDAVKIKGHLFAVDGKNAAVAAFDVVNAAAEAGTHTALVVGTDSEDLDFENIAGLGFFNIERACDRVVGAHVHLGKVHAVAPELAVIAVAAEEGGGVARVCMGNGGDVLVKGQMERIAVYQYMCHNIFSLRCD